MIAIRRVGRVHEVNDITSLIAQVSSLVTLLKAQNSTVSINKVQNSRVYLFDNCPNNPESIFYVGNVNRNNNPYLNTYNLGRGVRFLCICI